MELPASWGLRKVRTGDGKLTIVGKDDTGNDYTVRTCATGDVSESDVRAIAECDRERTTAKDFVRGVVEDGDRRRAAHERDFQAELEDAAGPVVNAGFERVSLGYSRAYARNFDRAFGG